MEKKLTRANEENLIYQSGYEWCQQQVYDLCKSIAAALDEHDSASAALVRFIGEQTSSHPSPDYDPGE